jgi:hypothetical protein
MTDLVKNNKIVMYTCFQNFRVHMQNQVTTILQNFTSVNGERVILRLIAFKKIMISLSRHKFLPIMNSNPSYGPPLL